jgi:hypothetical protein
VSGGISSNHTNFRVDLKFCSRRYGITCIGKSMSVFTFFSTVCWRSLCQCMKFRSTVHSRKRDWMIESVDDRAFGHVQEEFRSSDMVWSIGVLTNIFKNFRARLRGWKRGSSKSAQRPMYIFRLWVRTRIPIFSFKASLSNAFSSHYVIRPLQISSSAAAKASQLTSGLHARTRMA